MVLRAMQRTSFLLSVFGSSRQAQKTMTSPLQRVEQASFVVEQVIALFPAVQKQCG